MENENALVSVVIPCYNHAKYVEECIMSIIGQTYKNIQLIVIDDGSKDDSFAIIKRLGKQYGFITEKQANCGLSATLNKGISQYATGKYICCVASDDRWEPNKIEQQVAFIEGNEKYGMVCGAARYMNEKGEPGEVINFGGTHPYNIYSFENIFTNNQVIALTVMFKKSAWEEAGRYDEDSYIEDWDMWLKIAGRHLIGYQDKVLGFWRLHGNNSSDKTLLMAEAKMHVVNKWKHHALYAKVYRELFLKNILSTARQHKRATIAEMLKHAKYIFDARYLKAIVKLALSW